MDKIVDLFIIAITEYSFMVCLVILEINRSDLHSLSWK